jgi:hypothetical protein
VAQHYRDARITTIYEGTNGIQAMDLVGRKLPMRGGAVVADHLAGIAALDAELAARPELAEVRRRLTASLDAARTATDWLVAHAADPVSALAGATPYLRLLASVTGGALMARSALVALDLLDRGATDQLLDEGFLRAKVATARFFCEQVMPAADGLVSAVCAGADAVMAFDAAVLAD